MEETSAEHFEIDPEEADASRKEVTLSSGSSKPASTVELKNMLKEAGTELTIKYITGEISFEEFCEELEKRKPKLKQKQHPSTSVTKGLKSHLNIPNFDELMEDVGEEDGSNDDEEERDNSNINLESDEDNEYEDPVEVKALDKNDEEWTPDYEDMRELKRIEGKGKSERKRERDGFQIRHKKRKKRRCQYEVPKHLAAQNGQAMLLRAQGRIEESMKLLFEIIEKAPNAAAPFKTLGSIHEEKGDMEQALKFYMVSANLRKSDISEWFDLIDMWIRLKNERMVMMCFTKAFKYAQTREDKLEALDQRCLYYEKFGHSQKTILQCKGQILSYMDRSKPKEMLEFARTLSKNYLDIEEVQDAISTMLYYIQHLPNHIDSEDIHSLVELLMSRQNYVKSLEIIIKHCGVEMEVNNEAIDASDMEKILQDNIQAKTKIPPITKVTVPPLMPIDLRCKTMQCLMLAKVIDSVQAFRDLLTDLEESDVEEFGDVYYDVAETMFENGYPEEAVRLLQKLTSSQTYSEAAVWLTYGQCLNSLGKIEEAAKAYNQVLELVPSHYEARVTLSSLWQQMGHNEKALALLSKETEMPLGLFVCLRHSTAKKLIDATTIIQWNLMKSATFQMASMEGTSKEDGEGDQLLLLHRCQLLYSQRRIDEFTIAARQLLSFNFKGQFSPEFMKALMAPKTSKARTRIFQIINSAQDVTQEATDDQSDPQKSEQERFKREVWDVYLKLCKEMYNQNRLDELVEVSILAMSCPTFCFKYNDSKLLDAEFLCLKICIFSGRRNLMYKALKHCLSKEMDKNQAWNLYCYVITKFKNMIDLRFAMRALMKKPNSIALGMLNGSARLISGTYISALGEYLSVFRQNPENELAVFCCALCLAHMSSQKFSEKRNLLIPQVMGLMNAYKDMRGECQETYYNLGRVMQQLNMPFAAAHYYKKALECPPVIHDKLERFDLSHEIAFNLSLIYKKSGNDDYARYYIHKYCVI